MPSTDGGGTFVLRTRVRYGDCDRQGVVFNATYLAYVDDAVDVWLQDGLGHDYLDRFDYVVKKAAVEWSTSAGARDLLTLRPRVTRWGTTSFDVVVTLDVDRRRVAEATLTLVSVVPGEHTPVAVPVAVRRALDRTTTGRSSDGP